MTRRRILPEDLGFLMTRASAILVKETNRAMAPLGLKVRGYSVLAAVCDEDDGITQRRLAADVGLDPSQIVALVDDLEGRNLVMRTIDPDDRRNKLIVATEPGRELCGKARTISNDVAERHIAGNDAEHIDAVRNLLHHMVFAN
ncbi:MarR family winged helix-turn-helix transcriptional regulator [Gordonia sp. CPCC 206044]|uniref:MarR family winged helix-turn-helix transcriptional regulator n=1 Tax=Gordonia sp. CPCC 206044 TaxID=3140793 RepID=UPI003AF3F259